MLSYEFVPFGSVLQEKIENDCDTILDKTCSHMLKKGTFPRNTLSKSRLLWSKVVSCTPPPPRTMLQQTFSIFNRQFRWQWAQHATPNQHFVSTVSSKIGGRSPKSFFQTGSTSCLPQDQRRRFRSLVFFRLLWPTPRPHHVELLMVFPCVPAKTTSSSS